MRGAAALLACGFFVGCLPFSARYLRIDVDQGRYLKGMCRGSVGARSFVYYPYHGIYVSLSISGSLAFGLHIPAGVEVRLDGRFASISGVTDAGPLEIKLPLVASIQGGLGTGYPGVFTGVPDPFLSADNFGPLIGATQNNRYAWYLYLGEERSGHLVSIPRR